MTPAPKPSTGSRNGFTDLLREAPGPSAEDLAKESKGVLKWILGLNEQYGDVIGFNTPFGYHIMLSKPEHLEYVFHSQNFQRSSPLRVALGHGLLTSNGPYWRQQRRLLQYKFRYQPVLEFGPLVTTAMSEMFARWRLAIGENQELDLMEEMKYLTLEVIARAILSEPLEQKVEKISDAVTCLNTEIGSLMAAPLNANLGVDPKFNERVDFALKILDEFIFSKIEKRRGVFQKPDDVLTTLIDSVSTTSGNPLTDQQIRDEVSTLLLAGSETTANMLTWTLYLLEQNPDVKQQLRLESDRLLGGRLPSVEDLPKLEFTEMVINESMRIFPPVWSMARTAVQEDEIDGYRVPAGSNLLISPYVTHRRADLWPDPEKFIPQRFAPDQRNRHPRYAFCPFGGGRHTCLGEPFVRMEALMILAAIHQSFEIKIVPGFEVVPQAVVTLRPRDGIRVTLGPRETLHGGNR